MKSMSICLGLLLLALSAHGDTLWLNNGDRLSGELVVVRDGVATLKTSYAGELRIPVGEIKHMETGDPIVLRTVDETDIEGKLVLQESVQGMDVAGEWQALPVENIAALAPEKKKLPPRHPKRWHGELGLGSALRSGNTNTTDARFDASATRQGKRNQLQLGFDAAYGEAEEVLNTRRFAGTLTWRYDLNNRLYLLASLKGERDDGRKLDLRVEGGPGLGYTFLPGPKRTLRADLSLLYTHEEWAPFTPREKDAQKNIRRIAALTNIQQWSTNLGAGLATFDLAGVQSLTGWLMDWLYPLRDELQVTEDFTSARVGAHYAQDIFKSSRVTDDLALLPNLEQWGAFRMTNRLGLETPLSDQLQLRLELNSEYDSLAPEKEVEAWDHALNASLRYRF
jgi:putative salt-induced outer membrane protein YdiY